MDQVNPITYRYTLLGIRDLPERYIPRPFAHQYALRFALECMDRYSQQAMVTPEHMKVIRYLIEHPGSNPNCVDGFPVAINAAIRAVNIEVKAYKRKLVFTPNEHWGDDLPD